MPTAHSHPIDSFCAHFAAIGTGTAARRACMRWGAADPSLAAADPVALVARCHTSGRPACDDTIERLLLIGEGDEWAELTVTAILCRRLRWIAGRWARCGAHGDELADLEADLLARIWEQVHEAFGSLPPPAPTTALCDRAWSAVRARRLTDLRRARRACPLDEHPAAAVAPGAVPAEAAVTAVLVGEVAAGRMAVGPARALWATRVAGRSTVEVADALGTTSGAVRVLRARAATVVAARLVA